MVISDMFSLENHVIFSIEETKPNEIRDTHQKTGRYYNIK